MQPGKRYAVYAIRTPKDRATTIWVKAGVAHVNPDDSMTIVLDVLPLEGRLHVREAGPTPTDKTGE